MRFHIGLSFSFKKIKKYIPYLLLGFLFYFASHLSVFADELITDGYTQLIYENANVRPYGLFIKNTSTSISDENINLPSTTFNSKDYNLVSYTPGGGFSNFNFALSGIYFNFKNVSFTKDNYYALRFYYYFDDNYFYKNDNLLTLLSNCKLEEDTTGSNSCLSISNENLKWNSTTIYHNIDNPYTEEVERTYHMIEIRFLALNDTNDVTIKFGNTIHNTSLVVDYSSCPLEIDYPCFGDQFWIFGYKYKLSSSSKPFNYLNPLLLEFPPGTFDDPYQSIIDEVQENNSKFDEAIPGLGDFFQNFNDNDFGLSDIVSSPLILIKALSNGSICSSLDFNILGSDVSFPSGCILWDKVPESFEIIYYTFVGGFFSYIILINLFHDVNKLRDPKNSEVSTLDL